MSRDGVAATLQKALQVAVEVEHHTVDPSLARVGHLGAVDVEFEHIVVAVLQVEVFLEVSIAEGDVATDVDVAALTSPAAADVVAFAAPGSLFCAPCAVVEGRSGPAFAVLRVADDFAFPCLFVGHWGNG